MTSVQTAVYRLKTTLNAFIDIYRLPQEKIDAFLNSYESFGKDASEEGEEKRVADYYAVLNYLCALGEVEKMYIPPVIDPSKGVFENQILFEQKMSQDLGLQKNAQVLDIGCGRGRVAAHLARLTGAKVSGINIDEVQLESAKKNVKKAGLSNQCQFIKSNLNERLPFEDNFFDAVYEIQALTYAKDKEKLFAEMFRVLKPGGKLSFLDWVQLDNYDASNPHHLDLLKRVKPLIGAIDTPTPEEIKRSLEKVGFQVIQSKDVSIGNHQAPLIKKADKQYEIMKKIVYLSVKLHLLPAHFKLLFDRFAEDGESFIEADELGLFTTSFQTIAEKPKV